MFISKRSIITGLLAVLFGTAFVGCDSGNISSEEVELSSMIDSVSYSIGYLNGDQLRQQGMDDLVAEKYIAGFQQAMEEADMQIEEQELQRILQDYQMQVQENNLNQDQEEGQQNQEDGQAFLEENRDEEGVTETESGLQYRVEEEGSGSSPSEEDTVRVHYEGTLLDGTVFDSSFERGEPVELPLSGVIPGWTEGLQLMQEGATYTFWIPGELGYGENPPPQSPIGVNQTLVFEVELIEVL